MSPGPDPDAGTAPAAPGRVEVDVGADVGAGRAAARLVDLLPLLVLVPLFGAPRAAAAQAASDSAAAPTAPSGDTLPSAPPDTVRGLGPRPDTLPPDSIVVAPLGPDTLPIDTAAVDSVAADTLTADTIPVTAMPLPPPGVPPGWERAVWEWDRNGLLSDRATTLVGLLSEIPGVIHLKGGDFGMPWAVTAFGAGGGGVRVFRDGVEMLPVEGSMVDLSRVGLAGVEHVRVERRGDGLRVDLQTVRSEDPRPYSRIEAGTGDLSTNVLRGVFFHPRALGGNAGAALERVDTQGPQLQEPGAVTAIWLHYAYLRSEDLGLSVDLHRAISDRGDLYAPSRVTRSDWTLAGRWSPVDGVLAQAFWDHASLTSDSSSTQPFPFRNAGRSQWGGELSAQRGPLSARVTYRRPSGDGLPDGEVATEALALLPRWGGISGTLDRRTWSGRATRTVGLRGWTAPVFGLSAFGSVQDFERGVPALPRTVPDTAGQGGTDGSVVALPAQPLFSRGRSTRLGARFAWRGLELSGARLTVRRDSVHPLGLAMDREGSSVAVGDRSGWEVGFRVPLLLLDGLAVEGEGQEWGVLTDPWPYFPRRSWQIALTHHGTYFPTGNLEVWFDLGIEGRDGMSVALPAGTVVGPGGGTGSAAGGGGTGTGGGASPAALRGPPSLLSLAAAPVDAAGSLATVPSFESWYVRLQIRVVTVRIYVSWENFTLRNNNQDFPGRVLPASRAMYGVRWTLWN